MVLFTSSYLAKAIAETTDARQLFLRLYPLMTDLLGNGSPGEIFEANFALHLYHCHDIAAAQRAIMGDKAQSTYVSLGKTKEGESLQWLTGKIYSCSEGFYHLPEFPEEAIRDKDSKPNVVQWFIPESNSYPFLDFLLLVPTDRKWQLRCIQNTVGKSHSANVDELDRVISGLLDSGYMLCSKVVVAYIVEDLNKSGNAGLTQTKVRQIKRTISTTQSNSETQSFEYELNPFHVKYPRKSHVPS